jgi:hypothetical protein
MFDGETDEEAILLFPFLVYRRAATAVHIPIPRHGANSTKRFHIDVPDLNATRAHDAWLETET